MQLARLLEPRPRTLPSKLADMFRAVQLDLRLSKREILEQYLSLTPYGGNVEGVESAAWSYFGHAARHLTPLEIATLLAVPQGPTRYAPRPGNVLRLGARRDAILGKLIAAGVFPAIDAQAALAEAGRPSRPTGCAACRAGPPTRRCRCASTTAAGSRALDARCRRPGARRARDRCAATSCAQGIHSAAIVASITAAARSSRWSAASTSSTLRTADRSRCSSGRARPAHAQAAGYALAIDRGIALPSTWCPMSRPSTAPTGRATSTATGRGWSRCAMRCRDLNLPFIDCSTGSASRRRRAGRMGVAPGRTAPGEYGLSMIVGGISSRRSSSPGCTRRSPRTATTGRCSWCRRCAARWLPVFGPGAAWLTRRALAQKDRPDFPRRRDVAACLRRSTGRPAPASGFATPGRSAPAPRTPRWCGPATSTTSRAPS